MNLKKIRVTLKSEKKKVYTVTLSFTLEIYLKFDESQNENKDIN